MILIIDCGSEKVPFIEQAVDEFIDYKTVSLDVFNSLDLEDIKGVIISGAPILVTEVNLSSYLEKFNWIKEFTLPLLGICFGHQVLGICHNALASKMRPDRDWQLVEIFEECPLFERLPAEIEMMEDHCEAISIPENFKLVASSDACINEAMMHTEKPLFGVQFHPEVSGNHGRVLIDNFVRLCLKGDSL